MKKQWFALTFVLLFSVSCWPSRIQLGVIAASYASKEACSCLFVAGNTEEYCRDYVAIDPSAGVKLSLKFKTDEKKVTANVSIIQRSAQYLGPRIGCRLQ